MNDEVEPPVRDEAWERSVEREVDHLLYFASEEIREVIEAALETEKALNSTRKSLLERMLDEDARHFGEWRRDLEQAGYGPFESNERLDAFIYKTSSLLEYEPGRTPAEAVRFRVFRDWAHLQQSRQQSQEIEISDRALLFSRYGTVVTLHALLEGALHEVCVVAQRRRRSRVSLEDLARGGPDGFKERRYLEKVHGIELEPALWIALTPLVYVRNRIAHSSGRLPKRRSARDEGLIAETPGLSVKGHVSSLLYGRVDLIHVDSTFLMHCAQGVLALLEGLRVAMSQWDRLRPIGR